jgi:hypothetical protein
MVIDNMYLGSPYRSPGRFKEVPEGPITDFWHVIENVPPEEWQKRTGALQRLVSQIPTGSDYVSEESWFNSPKTLRHLCVPLAELLRDPRSSVVKRTCEGMTSLFGKCQDDARYLFKDLMPTILGVHAQTVQIIRNYVQTMITDSLPVVQCKMVMPIWMERLKSEKSRTVREACTLYLSLALHYWSQEDGYITNEIWMQVGASFIRVLRDPSPSVRLQAKNGLDIMRAAQLALWEKLVVDPDGPAAKDPRLQRALLQPDCGDNLEDLSVASRTSMANRSMNFASGRQSPVPTSVRSARSPRIPRVPTSISVAGTTRNLNNAFATANGLGPPMRSAIVAKQQSAALGYHVHANPVPQDPPSTRNLPPSQSPNGFSFDDDEESSKPVAFVDNPFIANIKELKSHARNRRSRRSSLLLQRWRSGSFNDDRNHQNEYQTEQSEREHYSLVTNPTESSTASAPHMMDPSIPMAEHIIIANQLLEAHQKHVDSIMETLKIEMETIREFEQILIDNSRTARPSADEVVEYFESVTLCLEQRASAAEILQREMDRISKG